MSSFLAVVVEQDTETQLKNVVEQPKAFVVEVIAAAVAVAETVAVVATANAAVTAGFEVIVAVAAKMATATKEKIDLESLGHWRETFVVVNYSLERPFSCLSSDESSQEWPERPWASWS